MHCGNAPTQSPPRRGRDYVLFPHSGAISLMVDLADGPPSSVRWALSRRSVHNERISGVELGDARCAPCCRGGGAPLAVGGQTGARRVAVAAPLLWDSAIACLPRAVPRHMPAPRRSIPPYSHSRSLGVCCCPQEADAHTSAPPQRRRRRCNAVRVRSSVQQPLLLSGFPRATPLRKERQSRKLQ